MKRLFFLFVLVLIIGCSEKAEINEEIISLESETTEIQPTGTVYTVFIEDFQFKPNILEIKVGDKVEWVNKDGVEHTVTFEDVRLDERVPDKGIVSHVFTEPGEARYFCALHPEMRGTIFVE